MPQNTKALLALALMACCVALVLLVGETSESVHEQLHANIEMETMESSENILEAIYQTRAFCLEAKDEAQEMQDLNGQNADTALIHLILEFGNDAHELEEEAKVERAKQYALEDVSEGGGIRAPPVNNYNVIVDYGMAMKTIKEKYKGVGVNDYLIDNLNEAILKGQNPIMKAKYAGRVIYQFDPEVIGLNSNPEYLQKLGVSSSKQLTTLAAVKARAANPDVRAAATWLKQGAHEQYQSFLDQAYHKVADQVDAYNEHLKDVALKAIQSRKDVTQLGGAALAGKDAAMQSSEENQIKVPTKEELKSAAAQMGQKWAEEHAAEATNEKVIGAVENGPEAPAVVKTEEQPEVKDPDMDNTEMADGSDLNDRRVPTEEEASQDANGPDVEQDLIRTFNEKVNNDDDNDDDEDDIEVPAAVPDGESAADFEEEGGEVLTQDS